MAVLDRCTMPLAGKTIFQVGRWLRLYRDDIGKLGDVYMRRWILWVHWLGMLRVHNILRSGAGRALHDHPFDFVTFIWWGGYTEITQSSRRRRRLRLTRRRYRAPTILFRRAEMPHRIEIEPGGSAWTFLITGPIRREWGLLTDAGWVSHRDYKGDP